MRTGLSTGRPNLMRVVSAKGFGWFWWSAKRAVGVPFPTLGRELMGMGGALLVRLTSAYQAEASGRTSPAAA